MLPPCLEAFFLRFLSILANCSPSASRFPIPELDVLNTRRSPRRSRNAASERIAALASSVVASTPIVPPDRQAFAGQQLQRPGEHRAMRFEVDQPDACENEENVE